MTFYLVVVDSKCRKHKLFSHTHTCASGWLKLWFDSISISTDQYSLHFGHSNWIMSAKALVQFTSEHRTLYLLLSSSFSLSFRLHKHTHSPSSIQSERCRQNIHLILYEEHYKWTHCKLWLGANMKHQCKPNKWLEKKTTFRIESLCQTISISPWAVANFPPPISFPPNPSNPTKTVFRNLCMVSNF